MNYCLLTINDLAKALQEHKHRYGFGYFTFKRIKSIFKFLLEIFPN